MKQMIYKESRGLLILDEGNIDGFNYVILSLGTHPTGYVEIPKDHKYYGCHYDSMDIAVHGGLTYSGIDYWNEQTSDKYYCGWDYAHLGDYVGYNDMFERILSSAYGSKDKKWTTEEILEDVKSVISQLKNME